GFHLFQDEIFVKRLFIRGDDFLASRFLGHRKSLSKYTSFIGRDTLCEAVCRVAVLGGAPRFGHGTPCPYIA
ncbi:MAG: hypothetical protein LBP68_01210, partial [Acidobacteriota bacterium]|nr:hypothetical protein [Acidobacteriota bacterium]